MTETAKSGAAPANQPPADQAAPKKKRGPGKRGTGRGPESGGEGRQGRARGERSVMAGFGDGMERAVCAGVVHALPSVFPASHRQGVATAKLVAVASTGSALLLCDGRHDGPHVWPNGDIVDEETGMIEPLIGTIPSPHDEQPD